MTFGGFGGFGGTPTTTDRLASALVAALGALTDPTKAGKADTGTYRYAYLTLPQLLAAVRPVFAAHGLAVTQTVQRTAAGVAVTTTVLHASGEQLDTPPLELACGPGAQDTGSAITYARRYQLAALVGLAGDDDDDGRAAQQSTPPKLTAARAKAAVLEVLEDRELAADLWRAVQPGRGPFTTTTVDELVALAGLLAAGTAHLEPADDGTPRLIVDPDGLP